MTRTTDTDSTTPVVFLALPQLVTLVPALLAISLLCLVPLITWADDQPEDAESAPWRDQLAGELRDSLVELDEFTDLTWGRFTERLGLMQPRYLASYDAYGDGVTLVVRGRVLANRPPRGPSEDDRWWDNLLASYQRWETDEVADVVIQLQWGEQLQRVVSDEEGYYQARFEVPDGPVQPPVVFALHALEDSMIVGLHEVFKRPPQADLLLVSDVDDTIIHTGLSQLRVAAQRTFLQNARTRKPLDGVAALYRQLVNGEDGKRDNPVFYVSNSGWNLWDLLNDFLALNALPDGPLLLRDLGPEADTAQHKLKTIDDLVRRFDGLPVLLIGDSGQHDADIYTEIAKRWPERVLAVYLRDVDPEVAGEDDERVRRVTAPLESLGIPFRLVSDSGEIAAHAAELGLLDGAAVAAVRRDVKRDQDRVR